MSIQNALDLLKNREEMKVEEVDVFGDKGPAYVKRMTGGERDDYTALITEIKEDGSVERKPQHYRAKLIACTLCDADGNLLFNPQDANHIKQIGQLKDGDLRKLYTKTQEVNALREEDEEEAVKNSEGALDSSSNSTSQEQSGEGAPEEN